MPRSNRHIKTRLPEPPAPDDQSPIGDASGYYEAYLRYASNLRFWLIAYGIGVPVTVLTNETLVAVLVDRGLKRWTIIQFLGGVSIQVAMALAYKSGMWQLYRAADMPADEQADFLKSRTYRFANWTSESLRLELGSDILTIVLYAIATVRLLLRI